MPTKLTKKAAQSLETRKKLLQVGRRLFGKRGFSGTGTEAIVSAARVTRGALYHHFADKSALFDAVVEDVAAEILAAIERAAGKAPTALEGLIEGCWAYLDACLSPPVRRIFLVDAPSVLGPARLRAIDAKYALGSLREGVDAALAESGATSLPADALTALISGALDEAVLWLMQNDDAKSRERLETALGAVLRRAFGRSRICAERKRSITVRAPIAGRAGALHE